MEFIDLLHTHNVPVAPEGHRHTRHGWLQFDCPFCGRGSDKFHMGYSLQDGYTTCWRCGSHYVVNVVMELLGVSYSVAKKLMAGVTNTRVEERTHSGKLVLPKGIGNLKKPHGRYLRERGFFPGELKDTWKIQGIGSMSRGGYLAWRIFIPIHYQGEMVSWTTRTIQTGKGITRYISASEEQELMPHRHLLYGEDLVGSVLYITEGPTDVWRIGPGGVATLGISYTPQQVERMARHKIRVIVFDSERQAQRRANGLLAALKCFPGETYNVELDAEDAGSATVMEMQQLREHFERPVCHSKVLRGLRLTGARTGRF